MSGEFEKIQPQQGAEVSKEGTGESEVQKFDPFLEERSLGATDKAESKTEKTAANKVEGFKEGGEESYSDYLARTKTPEENFAALKEHLERCCEKISQLQGNGFGQAKSDVTTGGSFLANVLDGSPDDVANFLKKVQSYISPEK